MGVGVYKFERGEELWRTTCRNRRFGGKSLINTLVLVSFGTIEQNNLIFSGFDLSAGSALSA